MASEADLRMEIDISRMLRAGVSLAATVVFVGGFSIVLPCAWSGCRIIGHFHGIPGPADRIAPILVDHHMDSRNIIRVGVLILIATPIMRVAYCVYSFAAQKDKIYIVVSGIVLTVLLYSFFHA